VTAGNVIRLLPPYIMTNEQADIVIAKVATAVIAFLQENKE